MLKRSKHQSINQQHIEVAAEKIVNHRLFSVVRIVKIAPIRIRIILVKAAQQEITKTVTSAEKIASIVFAIIHRDDNREITVADTVVKIVQIVGVPRMEWNHMLIGV